MNKYIDADRLLAILVKRCEEANSIEDWRANAIACGDVMDLPAADVVEVRHGKKKVYYHGENSFSYVCDQCEMPIDKNDYFCRWCGAKMDEVLDD